jgi:voltage-gated potassium channel Kch
MSSIADHVVIAGWNSEVPMILVEMEREYGADMPPVIVFAPRHRPEELDERFVFVQGDFRKEIEYDKVRLKYARTVVVVADDSGESVPAVRDASTVLTVFTIRSFERKLGDVDRTRPIHIVAEILDTENYEHATVAGANEVIETSRLGSSLLAHTAGNPGVGTVITNLMLASRNNVYSAGLPAAFIEGRPLSFKELQQRARKDYEVLVIGVVHNEKMTLNPPPSHRIYAGDKMVYIGPKNLE